MLMTELRRSTRALRRFGRFASARAAKDALARIDDRSCYEKTAL
jgi:hypothetical protein